MEHMIRKTLPLVLAASIATSAFAQQPALKGIEAADIDRSVQPCDDFYDFSNGAWRAKNPVPPRWIAGAAAGKRVRSIGTSSKLSSTISLGNPELPPEVLRNLL